MGEICDENCMLQVVEEETRGVNTLDLLYTNEVSLVTDIDVNESDISDHHRIEISTNYNIKEEKIQQNKSEKKDTMTSLNFHAKKKKKKKKKKILCFFLKKKKKKKKK